MIEIISLITLAILLISMFIFYILTVKEYNKQLLSLNKLLRAKDLTEFAVSESIKTEDDGTEVELPEYVPAESMDSKLFDNMINKQRSNLEEEE